MLENALDTGALVAAEERRSVSLGNDLRLDSERFTGAGLEFEDQIIKFSLFSSENGNGSSKGCKMRWASARRESHSEDDYMSTVVAVHYVIHL